jgi:methylmalonyl-CoA mutase C-terminal domain/subunit
MGARRDRVLIAKPGLDSHDRGAKIIVLALRDAGMEVIYTGIRCTPEQIVNSAIQEDVDIIGLSILSGAHMKLVPKVLQLLKNNRAEDIKVIVGGTIPKNDIEQLKKLGVVEIFVPGTEIKDIVNYIQNLVHIH